MTLPYTLELGDDKKPFSVLHPPLLVSLGMCLFSLSFCSPCVCTPISDKAALYLPISHNANCLTRFEVPAHPRWFGVDLSVRPGYSSPEVALSVWGFRDSTFLPLLALPFLQDF